LILTLNPVIRGWAMYHRHVVAAKRFAWIDHQIWQVLWRWAVRRHAMKNAHWVKQRYFRVVGQRHWAFATQEKARGLSQPAWLYAAASVSIVRHIKICSAANPFDPAWTFYLERRRAHRQVTQSYSGCWKA